MNNMYRVHVFAERNMANGSHFPGNDGTYRQYPLKIVSLPFIPEPGDYFTPHEDFAAMEVKRREVSADSNIISLIIEGSNWSYDELEGAGFKVKM